MINRRLFLRLAASAAAAGAAGFRFGEHRVRRAAFRMGSIVTITAYSPDRRLADVAIGEAFREMKELEGIMSVFDDTSQLSVLNREGASRECPLDSRLAEVLRESARYHETTQGAFDPTVEALMKLYGFRDEAETHSPPDERGLALALDGVGMKHLVFHAGGSAASFDHPSTRIDLGGIGVGYAVDRAARILRSRGLASAIINHSGDIYAIGAPPGEETWDVEIVDPERTGDVMGSVRIRDQALSTSGNYENFVVEGGVKIGHILDPCTGRSASSMLSATVVAGSALEADALSTGFFVMGAEDAARKAAEMPGVRLLAVGPDGSVSDCGADLARRNEKPYIE